MGLPPYRQSSTANSAAAVWKRPKNETYEERRERVIRKSTENIIEITVESSNVNLEKPKTAAINGCRMIVGN